MKRALFALALLALMLPVSAAEIETGGPPSQPNTNTQDVASKATTTNTIQTSGPVTSETKISVGTLAGEVLTWLAAAFSVPIGTLLTVWLLRLFQMAGLQATKQMSEELNKVLVNGLNDAARNGAKLATGRGVVTIKDPIVASAIQYTINRMPDTIKALGMDPTDGSTVEVLRARVATLAADPALPAGKNVEIA